MLHLTGAALVMAAAFWLRTALRTQRSERRRALRDLASALTLLSDAVRTTLSPLPHLLQSVPCALAARGFFDAVLDALSRDMPLARAWCLSAEMLPLPAREQALLASLAAAFGGDEQAVCTALTQTAAQLLSAERALADAERAESRVADAICLGGGAIVCILLL